MHWSASAAGCRARGPQLKRISLGRKARPIGSTQAGAKETREEREARRFFESLGYTVSRVLAPSGAQHADYRVHSAGERLVVEVKMRGPDEKFAKQLRDTGRAGSEAAMARTNVISGQVSEAAAQLQATDPNDTEAVRLIAFVAGGGDPDLQVEQFKKTVLGIVDLLTAKGDQAVAIPCYFFTFSDFYRFSQIAGAVSLSPRGAHLYLNPVSPQLDQLRGCQLFVRLASASAVTDPHASEREGAAFIADTGIDRKKEAEVLQYVRAKYSRPELLTFEPIKVTAAVVTPYETLGPSDGP